MLACVLCVSAQKSRQTFKKQIESNEDTQRSWNPILVRVLNLISTKCTVGNKHIVSFLYGPSVKYFDANVH